MQSEVGSCKASAVLKILEITVKTVSVDISHLTKFRQSVFAPTNTNWPSDCDTSGPTEMECVKEGYNITLHVADLLVQNDTVEVEEVGGGDVEVFKLEYDTAREFLVIQLQVQYNLTSCSS